jgi:hypothetical protein
MEAALVETNAGFDLSSQALLDLDRAGVADSVIDAMVALSYPRAFVVDRPAAQASSTYSGIDIDNAWFGSWPFPYYRDYWTQQLYSPYFYAPFGYAYWGSYTGYYPYGSFTGAGFLPVPIETGDGSGGDGRAVKGVGYTRIRTRAEADAQAAAGRRTTDSGTSSLTSGARGDSSSSGSSAGVSSSGFSSGSSSGDTGRTAQPR